jgi:hypothetical protein
MTTLALQAEVLQLCMQGAMIFNVDYCTLRQVVDAAKLKRFAHCRLDKRQWHVDARGVPRGVSLLWQRSLIAPE